MTGPIEASLSKSEMELLMLRNLRNELLQESDWITVKALETSKTIPSAWKIYRQELRDITKKYSSINDDGFKWPTKPS